MLEQFQTQFLRWMALTQPSFRPILPSDPTAPEVNLSEIRKLFFQFTELFRWAVQMVGKKKGEERILRTQMENSIRFAQVGATRGSLSRVEREIKNSNIDTVNQLSQLEAEIAVLEGLAAGYNAALTSLSREITIRLGK